MNKTCVALQFYELHPFTTYTWLAENEARIHKMNWVESFLYLCRFLFFW